MYQFYKRIAEKSRTVEKWEKRITRAYNSVQRIQNNNGTKKTKSQEKRGNVRLKESRLLQGSCNSIKKGLDVKTCVMQHEERHRIQHGSRLTVGINLVRKCYLEGKKNPNSCVIKARKEKKKKERKPKHDFVPLN